MKQLFSVAALAAILCLTTSVHANNGGCGGGGGGGGGGNGGGCGGGGGGWGGGGGGNGGCGGGSHLDCDAGGPYSVDAAIGFVQVHLNGLDSHDAQGYHWSTSLPGAFFDNANTATPTLSVPVTNDCSFHFTVNLTVTRGNDSKSCSATVRVKDHTPPVITCPDDAKLLCGQDTSPEALGYATAVDACDTDVHITYHDTIVPGECAARRFDYTILRKWKATDDDCNKSTCTQTIDVVKRLMALDVLPGTCPNVYNRSACGGTIPIAILGVDGINVSQVNWSTVRLWLEDCAAGPVAPENFCVADVGGPNIGQFCACPQPGPDGKLDLVANFKRSKLNERLHLDCYPAGTVLRVVVEGRLCDGCHFLADDCIVLQ